MVDLTEQERADVLSAADWINRRRNLVAYTLLGCVLALTGIVMWAVLVQAPRDRAQTRRANANATLARRAADQATTIEANQLVLERARCESSNDFKRADRVRWQYIIDLSPPPATAEARDRLERFKAYIDEADALRDCTKDLDPTSKQEG